MSELNTPEIDVGEKEQVKTRKKKYKLVRENELEGIKQILGTPLGRRFLWRVLARCHMFHSISYPQAVNMAIKSGERDIGLWLINEINAADKNGYIRLITEAGKD